MFALPLLLNFWADLALLTPASLAVALQSYSALSLSASLTTYLLNINYNLGHITAARTLSSVIEFSSTNHHARGCFPPLQSRPRPFGRAHPRRHHGIDLVVRHPIARDDFALPHSINVSESRIFTLHCHHPVFHPPRSLAPRSLDLQSRRPNHRAGFRLTSMEGGILGCRDGIRQCGRVWLLGDHRDSP